jgi:hypothetical protein
MRKVTNLSRDLALLLALLLFSAGFLRAEDEAEETFTRAPAPRLEQPEQGVLPFWEIGLAGLKIQTPRPFVVPSESGEPTYFWYWTYSFTAKTNLERLRDYLKQQMPNVQESAQEQYENHLAKLEKTISQTKMLKDLAIVMHTDTGQIIPDTSSTAVRNMLEKHLRQELMTSTELAAKVLKEDEIINAVAIFPALAPEVKKFEIRVYGLGKRFVPKYEPGKLMYVNNVFDSTLVRALRYSYSKTGGGQDDFLDPIDLESKIASWVWIWPPQVVAGHARKIDIERAPYEKEQPGLIRQYRYIPYKIHNNTSEPQPFEVISAGLAVKTEWQGERILFRMTDIGEADDFWKTQVMRKIKEQVESGEEATLVNEVERPGVGAEGEAVEADLKAKADIYPVGKERHFRGVIAPEDIVKGLIIIRWGLDDIEAVVDDIVAKLRIKSMVLGKDEEPQGELLKAYEALRTPVSEDTKKWQRTPEPPKEQVIEVILKVAQEDLDKNYADNNQPTDDEKRRYGEKLGPLGHLLNILADERVTLRMNGDPDANPPKLGGNIDVFFEVKWDGVCDSATFPSNFKRQLPTKSAAYKEMQENADVDFTNRKNNTDDGGEEEDKGEEE